MWSDSIIAQGLLGVAAPSPVGWAMPCLVAVCAKTRDRSSHLWRVLYCVHTTRGAWGPSQAYSRAPGKVKGSPGQDRDVIICQVLATVSYVTRICNPESVIKQLSPKAAFYSSQSISFFSPSLFWAKGISQSWELVSENILSLIWTNIAMEPWDSHWWAPKVGGYWLCLESEFSWGKKGIRRKENHSFSPLLRQSIYEGGINTK